MKTIVENQGLSLKATLQKGDVILVRNGSRDWSILKCADRTRGRDVTKVEVDEDWYPDRNIDMDSGSRLYSFTSDYDPALYVELSHVVCILPESNVLDVAVKLKALDDAYEEETRAARLKYDLGMMGVIASHTRT